MAKPLKIDAETKAIAEICKALGHPTRVQIMTLLWKEIKELVVK